jgi:hypothetical protein
MAMQHSKKDVKTPSSEESIGDKFDIDALLHPARAFKHPMNVVRDADLTLNEKRAILAAWASDACALAAIPDLRHAPSAPAWRFDDVMDALLALNREESCGRPLPHYKRVLAEKRDGQSGKSSRSQTGGGHGPMLH